MTDASPKSKATIIALCSILLAVAIIATFLCFRGMREQGFVRINGLGEGTIITVILEQHGKASSLVPQADGETILYPAPEEKISGPYALNLTLQKDAAYRDIRFTVNGAGAVIVAEGFTPKAELSLNEQSGLHFDWAGRIELQQDLKNLKGPLCLKIEDVSICHTVPKVAQ